MGKLSNFLIGLAVGGAAGAVVTYLFGPPSDEAALIEGNPAASVPYQSRLDRALIEGEQAAVEQETLMRRHFELETQARPNRLSTSDG